MGQNKRDLECNCTFLSTVLPGGLPVVEDRVLEDLSLILSILDLHITEQLDSKTC